MLWYGPRVEYNKNNFDLTAQKISESLEMSSWIMLGGNKRNTNDGIQ